MRERPLRSAPRPESSSRPESASRPGSGPRPGAAGNGSAPAGPRFTAEPDTGAASPGAEPSAEQDPLGTGAFPSPRGTAVSRADLAALREQLGREPRGVVAIAARCVCGRPTVVRTAPRLPDGSPFPTSYYLTHPVAVRGCSTLEAEHLMDAYNQALADDDQLAAAYARAHEDYLARRAELGVVAQIEGISAGGMPTRVKCLHALVGHALAAGPGTNPIGDLALAALAERGLWDPSRCSC